jgi:hypothetical protein
MTCWRWLRDWQEAGGWDAIHRLLLDELRKVDRNVITNTNGTPPAYPWAGANWNDVTRLIPLVNAIPAIRGKPGRPLQRPKSLLRQPRPPLRNAQHPLVE